MSAVLTQQPEQHPPIRVLLVDGHEQVLCGLRELIDGEQPKMIVAGTAKSVPEAIAAIWERKPHVVVLDVFLGEENSLDHLHELLEIRPIELLILTGSRDPALYQCAMERGACAVVSKDKPTDVLLREIERAYALREPPATRQ